MNTKNVKEYGIMALIAIVFLGLIFLPNIFTGFDLAFQIVAACLAAILTMVITQMLLKNQSTQEENKDKSIKIYENKIAVYSAFISSMWKTLEDDDVDDTELRALRSDIYNKLIFYLNPAKLSELTACVDAIFAERKKLTDEDSEVNEATIREIYISRYSEITNLLRDDLHGSDSANSKSASEALTKLWKSFKIEASEESTEPAAGVVAEEVEQPEEVGAPVVARKSYNFWHFNILGYNQFRAFKKGIYELSLIEYGEEWRTTLLRQVKMNDIVFLFRRNGYGYVGAYRVIGKRIFDYDGENLRETLTINGDKSVITDQEQIKADVEKYDIYKGLDDNADLCSNLIVEPLAYYDNGVKYPGGVYRRTISRYDKGYARILLSRFAAVQKDAENFNRLHESSGKVHDMGCTSNASTFQQIITDLSIEPAAQDNAGNWI